jgi:RecA/RadA recombinase
MEAYLGVARQGWGCFVIDCGTSYNARRLLQLSGSAALPAHHITLFRPRTFEEQSELIARLHLLLDPTIRLIVVDPITSLYRRQITREGITWLYRELAERQLPRLVGLARDHNLAVIVVNQISTWNGEDHPVGGDAIRRYAALEIRVNRLGTGSTASRWLVLCRPRNLEPHRRIVAELHASGFRVAKAVSRSPDT